MLVIQLDTKNPIEIVDALCGAKSDPESLAFTSVENKVSRKHIKINRLFIADLTTDF